LLSLTVARKCVETVGARQGHISSNAIRACYIGRPDAAE
jgi:hypothetical protein